MKRLCALFLRTLAVPLLPLGLGLMVYGLFTRFDQTIDQFSVGVSLVILGALLWLLATNLDGAARLMRYRRQQNRIVRLARQRGGQLTVVETAAETGLAVEEAEEILRTLADGTYVQLKVTDSGIVVYQFPEILYAEEK